MTRRRIIVIMVLVLVGIASWLIPFDVAAHCSKLGTTDILICLFRNGGLTIGRIAAPLLAVAVALKIRPRDQIKPH
jgi:hypothetical protein